MGITNLQREFSSVEKKLKQCTECDFMPYHAMLYLQFCYEHHMPYVGLYLHGWLFYVSHLLYMYRVRSKS